MAMAVDAAARSSRPRPWLLAALAVTAGLFLITQFWPGNPAASSAPLSNPSRARAPQAGGESAADPPAVRLDALAQPRPDADTGERNPFRFYVKPPPPPPPPPPPVKQASSAAQLEPVVPAGPPPPPPITLKFIGTVEPKPGDRVAAFSDCRTTTYGRDGDVIAGQFRLVRIGVESVVMEYLDGRGRTTIRLSGQDCVGK